MARKLKTAEKTGEARESTESRRTRSSYDAAVRPRHVRLASRRLGRPGLHAEGDGATVRQRSVGQVEAARRRSSTVSRPGRSTNTRSRSSSASRSKLASTCKGCLSSPLPCGKDGLIQLPGQFGETDAGPAVLADLQAGLTLTFLQHGKVRKLAKEATTVSYDPEGEGIPGVVVEYRKCSGFKHQAGWQEFADKNGQLISGVLKVDGPISPGSVVRHVAFTSSTAAEEPPERMLPLYFALVGCLSLPVNRGVAALIVPEVENLRDFIYDRPAMTPSTARDCQIANAADAGFRAQIRRTRQPGAASRNSIQGQAGIARLGDSRLLRDDLHADALGQPAEVARGHDPRARRPTTSCWTDSSGRCRT